MADPPRRCPVCGAVLRPYGRGATERKHGRRWVCPAAEGLAWTIPGHRRPWTDAELAAAASPAPVDPHPDDDDLPF